MPIQQLEKVPKSTVTGRTKRTPISEKEAQKRATRILSENLLSQLQTHVINSVAIAGSLTPHQINALVPIASRTFRKYTQNHYLDYVVAPASLSQFRLPVSYQQLRVYTLGAVGRAIVAAGGLQPILYEGYSADRLTHDVLCNEAAIALIAAARAAGWETDWYGKTEARIQDPDAEKKTLLMEPDSLLVFRRPGMAARGVIIELHNEDHKERAKEKVLAYERKSRSQHWRDVWPVTEFPTVLAVAHARAVVDGYREAITERSRLGLNCNYAAKSVADIVARKNIDVWSDLKTGQPLRLFK